MQYQNQYTKLAQSASAIGAALLGFGIGAKWGGVLNSSLLITIIAIGGIIHVGGMYVMQMRTKDKADPIARLLWITAWICLVAVVALYIYLALKK